MLIYPKMIQVKILFAKGSIMKIVMIFGINWKWVWNKVFIMFAYVRRSNIEDEPIWGNENKQTCFAVILSDL